MKSKNFISLSVALVFLILGTTGLLIYFGQGNHAIEHTHAWFGILFVSAAVFHIMNNWSSLLSYTKDRKTGSLRREFIIPLLITVLFVVGVSADIPGFAQLANAGKLLFRGDGPRRGPLTQQAVDSIAHNSEVIYSKACSAKDTSLLSTVLSPKATIWNENNQVVNPFDSTKFIEPIQYTVEKAESVDDNVIWVHGSGTESSTSKKALFTHILKKEENKWHIVAGQLAITK
ncbi:DUF4405 domain-containing protein [Spirosoma litoris]